MLRYSKKLARMVNSGVKGSEAVEVKESPIKQQQEKKMCVKCGTSKTPLWRSGPEGPKTLCNACGIRSKKKKGPVLGPKKRGRKRSNNGNSNGNGSSNGESFKQRLRNLVSQVLPQRSPVERHWKKLGEVERAALLLMSFSA